MTSMVSLGEGYNALVIGASGGIGSAIAARLEADPRAGTVTRLSRSVDGVDLTDEGSIARHAAQLEGRRFQLIFCATGALTIDGRGPEKSLRQIEQQAMLQQFALNAVGPALVIRHFAPLLPRDAPAKMAFLSARVGSIGDNRLGGWISYRAAKAALNQIIRTASVEIARSHPQAVLAALHPGTVATPLSADYAGRHPATLPEDAAANLLTVLDRLDPTRSGSFHAYDGEEIVW